MKWFPKGYVPAIPGWYWHQSYLGTDILEVFQDETHEGKPYVDLTGGYTSLVDECGDDRWAGPLKPPKGTQKERP